jgi:hypothetical protein
VKLLAAILVFSAAPALAGVSVSGPPPVQPQLARPMGAVGAPGAPGPGSDDPAAELIRLRAEQSKAYESLNALNPFSESYGKIQGAVTAATGPVAQLQKLLSQPAVQGYLKLFSSPAFSQGVDQVLKSPSRMTLLYAELGWIVFMLIFRAWRFSKSTHWAARLWTRFWTFVLGEPYIQTVSGMIEVLARH